AHLRPRIISLSEALGRAVSPEALIEALCEGFREEWGISLEPGELTPWERARLPTLCARYRSLAWNLRR
ncbi:MAG: hypothetical protein ACP5SI_00480, partial [Chloroflexia bacterium]